MIEFLEVSGENFLSFESFTLSLKKRGLVTVRGENLDDSAADSNDAGKTNLFSAISWCLFERIPKLGNKLAGDEIILAGSTCGTVITLKLQLQGIRYTIERFRSHPDNGNKVFLQGGKLKSAGRREATNEEIERALGLTYPLFLRTVFWAQGTSVKRLTKLTDAEYKTLFDELVDTSRFQAKRDRIAQELKDASAAFGNLERDKLYEEGNLSAYQTSLETLEKYHDTKDYSEAIQAIKDFQQIDGKFKATDLSLTNIRRERTRTQNKADSLQAELVELSARLKDVEDGALIKKCNQCGQKLMDTASALLIAATIKAHKKTINETAIELSTTRSDLKELDADIEALVKKYDKQKISRDAIQHAMSLLLPADLSKKSLTPATAIQELATRQADVIVYKGQRRSFKRRILETKKRMGEIEAGISGLTTRMIDLSILDRAYGPAGFRSMILEELTPSLDAAATSYSERLSNSAIKIKFSTVTILKSGEVRERYHIDVSKDENVRFILSGGGMSRRADLIAACALERTRAELSGVEINMRIYDEPTDGLDAAGEMLFVQMLRDEPCDTKFFISHKALVGDNLFDDVVKIQRQNGISKIR